MKKIFICTFFLLADTGYAMTQEEAREESLRVQRNLKMKAEAREKLKERMIEQHKRYVAQKKQGIEIKRENLNIDE